MSPVIPVPAAPGAKRATSGTYSNASTSTTNTHANSPTIAKTWLAHERAEPDADRRPSADITIVPSSSRRTSPESTRRS